MDKRVKILISEDEVIIARDIYATLERLGYNPVAIVSSGEEAIKKASELKPDLVLMDVMLNGEMSGIEAADIIMRSMDIPVIYLTALSDESTLNKAKITSPLGYILKPFDEKMLHSTIEMALYKHEMNSKLRERTEELEIEKKKSDMLLNNILPSEIVKELKEKGVIKPRLYDRVTLLFTDFQGFTTLTTQMEPQELVSELNDIFRNFDVIITKYGLEKLKTIGDSYLIGGGLPTEDDNHAMNVVSAAVELHDYIRERNKHSRHKWQMRAGIHSGSVIAGIIGKHKFTYDVWGDTVAVTNKLEQQCLPGRINISGDTLQLIKDTFGYEYFGKMEVNNGGAVEMYLLKETKLTEVESVKHD